MLLYYLLFLLPIEILPYNQFNIYNPEYHPDRHCLLYYVLDHRLENGLTYKPAYQIIPYCLRSSNDSIFVAESNFNNTRDPRFTFDDLHKANITSEQLLSWSATIDLAERYEMFLTGASSENETVFYNCTSNWFGPLCRFRFPIADKTFDQIIDYYFQLQYYMGTSGGVTCYKHLNCRTSSVCLDWREICDRKIDCLDGSDELNCWQLEIDECNQNEYRCHNGQCIPEEFYYDAPINPDCMDQTDERFRSGQLVSCSLDPSFRCEESVCRSTLWEIPCGAGYCASETMFSCPTGRNHLVFDDFCSKVMDCRHSFPNQISHSWCRQYCPNTGTCIKTNCSSIYQYPPVPILFKHVRLLFERELIDKNQYLPDYVCYNEQLCRDFLPATISKNNLTCRHFREIDFGKPYKYDSFAALIIDLKKIFRRCTTALNETYQCNDTSMYQCAKSPKCISKYRLIDGIADCPYLDDESFNESCSLNNAHYRFKCLINKSEKCLAPTAIQDEIEHCDNSEDELSTKQSPEDDIRFPNICDGYQDLKPMLINEQQETDETNCEHWLCNNTYTRCDRFWSCGNGADEINCPPSTCPQFEHVCVFPNDTSKLSCLPIHKAGDNIIDCLGASDERVRYLDHYSKLFFYQFHCWNDTNLLNSRHICNKKRECRFGDDEIFCKSNYTLTCLENTSLLTEIEVFFCALTHRRDRSETIYFTLRNIQTYPSKLDQTDIPSLPFSSDQSKQQLIQSNPVINIQNIERDQCNRGIPMYIRISYNQSKLSCLCPPSYYGDQCQYQNQRISLTIQIKASSNLRQVFTFLITLISNEEQIESYDYIEYLPIRDCDRKFNIYLLYLTRPKNLLTTYSVRIDVFNKLTLRYRSSWIFPIRFSFLPVYRLSISLKIPYSDIEPSAKCRLSCIHGQCFNYINAPNSTFCRCLPQWSGIQCDIPYTCNCAPGSLCAYNSICICPVNRFGPRCYLHQSSCHSKSCENGGRCVATDERYLLGNVMKSICLCSEEYSGTRCEHRQSRIEILFHNDLIIPSSLTVHFIAAQYKAKHIQTDLVKKVPFDQTSIVVHTSIKFNIAFVKFSDDYYLIIVREQPVISANIITKILPSHRCVSVQEIFNESFAREHLLKRIKYFQIPCQRRSELVCFSDRNYLCLCDLNRRANCFEFEHKVNFNCRGQNFCENQARCLENDPQCPTSSICACQACNYGSTCRFSTEDSTLLLDIILGFRIHRNIGLTKQPLVVKVSIVLATILLCVNLISNFLSYLTFKSKKIRQVGCGIYLFVSSIVSMIIMSVFTIKFWFLVLSQIGSITNDSFMNIQCKLIDFFLRCLLNINGWLHGYVAVERALNVYKGIQFNQRKSSEIAKWLVLVIFVLTVCTFIHDPIHRRLVHDEEDQRTWCVTEYTLSLKKYDWVVNLLHFLIPFLINCISALIIIINSTRIRVLAQKKEPYKQVLYQQFQHHKHLLISPILLIMLALPRLIISFISGCMKSTQDSWLYLIGYFISFIPPTLNLFIFVLPSKTYKEQLIKSIQHFFRS